MFLRDNIKMFKKVKKMLKKVVNVNNDPDLYKVYKALSFTIKQTESNLDFYLSIAPLMTAFNKLEKVKSKRR